MLDKWKGPWATAQKVRWEDMIEEAPVDCYNEYEEFTGMLATLEDRLESPFQAWVQVLADEGDERSVRSTTPSRAHR
jgi:hypothetical protein